MSNSALYDDDILLWSEQQAEIIRRLGRTRRDLPNEFDIENVAEEVESVGRSELAAVESYIELVLSHLIKIAFEPESESSRHWHSEVIAFHGNMKRRYADSMRGRIALEDLWRLARKQAITASLEPKEIAERLPESCPFRIDDILADDIATLALAELLAKRRSAT
jgi:hypothetical protein